MRISSKLVSPPQVYALGVFKKHENISFTLKSADIHVEKFKPYGFTKIDFSVLSAKVETKDFTVRVLEFSESKASVSLWKKNMNEYTLNSFVSKEFDWMAGYVSNETGIDKKTVLKLFRDVLDKFSKGLDISEEYIASALRRLNPSIDPKKAMKIAKDIKVFLESIISIMKLHKKSAENSEVVEILKMTLKSYTFSKEREVVDERLEKLA